MASYLEAVRERVVVFDGATGTNLFRRNLSVDDYGGPQYEGCPEMLNAVRPDVVADLHRSFFDVGVDAVETNSFGGSAITLAEYGIAHRTEELNRLSAEIAREVASGYGGFVAGSMGPGTKLPTLGHIRFAELRDAYEAQARGLLLGGVDVLVIETCYDLLQLKAAVVGARNAMRYVGREDVPLQLQVTMELTGRMLVGTEIGAALTAILALRPAVVGLNCATGPKEMSEHLRHLSQHSPVPIACLPNAGLPSVVDGREHYDLTPGELAAAHERFVTEFGVSVVGGCCGTTPEHLRAVVERVRGLTPGPRAARPEPGAASIYSHVAYDQSPSYLSVGERCNANGSKPFKEAMLAEDWETCVRIGQDQVRDGAHVLDLCVDYVGRDGVRDMDELARRFATQVTVPVMLDSTEPAVLEAGLQWIGGKAFVNSANLEEGDAEGGRFDRVMSMARDYGAGVVCMCIDETGQARTAARKFEIARRIRDLAWERYGIPPEDLFFDTNTLTIATGMEESRRDAFETIEGIRRIKAELPGVHTSLGVSNVSFGLSPAARHVLNSVFLHEAQQAGLDAAMVHPARIVPLNRIDPAHVEICLDLIYDRRREEDGYDPLAALMAAFEGVTVAATAVEDRSGWPVGERLKQRIVDGDRDGLEDDLAEALASGTPALSIINDDLLAGMKVVGELFGSGQMQLPFVLQSAETMKAAVRYLEPHMEKADAGGKGTIVLATVRGDVHDIGKNLVDIILTNNGYTVYNLGIKVPLTDMVEKALEVGADALGMSGLLVKSTLVMRDNLEELNSRGLAMQLPVLLGGAALTRTYVERDLRAVYDGRLFYGKDAFEGLRTMDRLMELKRSDGGLAADPGWGREPGGREGLPQRASSVREARRAALAASGGSLPKRSPEVDTRNRVFVPPFVGSKVVKGISLDEIAAYLNETALFRTQWGFRPDKSIGEKDDAFKARVRPVLREQLSAAKAKGVLVPQVVYGYFPVGSDGDDLVVFSDVSRSADAELERFTLPRQTVEPYLCIADFFRPLTSSEVDYAAFHIVTMGPEVTEEALRLKEADRYQDYLFLHGLGVEMTEALAELWHRRVREEWGFADEDGPTLAGLFRQQYRGGRYSWGYPACPDLEDNERVARLLDAARIGVSCSEETSFQYHPEQTTSAVICHHPQAKYFVA
jgi:5-methyltetrahydrofolate--homocysteine methyltransferase